MGGLIQLRSRDSRGAVHYGMPNYGDFPRMLGRILTVDEPLNADL